MKTIENTAIIYGVKLSDKIHYVGKTNKRRVETSFANSKVQAQYKNQKLHDIFKNYENVSIESITFVPENEWFSEKLSEITKQIAKNQPLVNAQWMLEGKRGYWDGKKRDAHTLLMLSESKYKLFVEYDINGNLKKVWKSGKEIGLTIFNDYKVINGSATTRLYQIVGSSSIRKRFAMGSYWFKLEELITHFNGIPQKLNIPNLIKKEKETLRLRRILTHKNATCLRRHTIECYDRKSGDLITIYSNAEEAGYVLKVHHSTIRRICVNKTKPAADFILKYGEKTLQPIKISYPKYEIKPLKRLKRINN